VAGAIVNVTGADALAEAPALPGKAAATVYVPAFVGGVLPSLMPPVPVPA
jgi:hypothetical protein